MESKKVDPGWNDPPMLNYSSANPPKSRIGNKRVAFPLGPSSTSTSSPSLTPCNNMPCGSIDLVEEKILDMEQVTFANFDLLMKSTTCDDVVVKIELMKNMWRTGQFTTSLKNDIYELSNSIVKNDKDSASKLHLKLSMNSSNECKTWISATQYFINNLSK